MFNGSEESYIILQNTLLTGIKEISFQSDVKESSTKLLANKGLTRKINGPAEVTCSFSKPYNGMDFCQYLTGITNLSGQFIYGTSAINFTDAAISEYSLNLNEQGLGEVRVQIKVYGEMIPTTTLRLSEAAQDFQVLDQTPKLQILNLDNTKSAIKSLNFESSFNLKSSNQIGAINRSSAKITLPVQHKISANIEMLEQEVEDITGMVKDASLTKNILAVFAPDENVSSIDRIFEIQSTASEIESSGVYLDDLDFSIGTCAYNYFKFPKSSISSQQLNSNAGEIAQLKKTYSAYSDNSSPSVFITNPSDLPSCTDHLSQLEENLTTSLFRWNNLFYGNQIDFEDREAGQTDFNLWLREITTREPKTGEDFELKILGEYPTNIKDYVGIYYENQIDFENKNAGQTDEELLGFVDIYYETQVDFENISTGETNQDLNQF